MALEATEGFLTGVAGAESGARSTAAGGVGGRLGAAEAVFGTAACGGVGGRPRDWFLLPRNLEAALRCSGSGATRVCLTEIGVGRALFLGRACSGEDLGIRRWARASVLGLSCSNMDIKELVGGIGSESTASTSCRVFTLRMRRGFLDVVGVGLALRLAARVAAMRLGLLASILASAAPTPAGDWGEKPRARWDDGDVDGALADEAGITIGDALPTTAAFAAVATPRCCRRAATRPAGSTVVSVSTSCPTACPCPCPWWPGCAWRCHECEGERPAATPGLLARSTDDVAARRAPLSR